MSKQEFIKKARDIHGETYKYNNVEYISSSKKVCIICPKDGHGEFWQTPGAHLYNKSGCPKCCHSYKLDTNEFIKRSQEKHGETYKYNKTEYIDIKTKVCIICPKDGHGEFWQIPDSHFHGNGGCSACFSESTSIRMSNTHDDFLSKSIEKHGDLYDYSQVDYKDSQTKVTIICKVPGHGPFLQVPSSHIQGRGCPCCVFKTEQKLYEMLKPKYPTLERQYKQDWCMNKRHLPFDFCIPELNIIIELDGAQHFIQVSNWKSHEETFKNDIYKEKMANDNEYSVIRIIQEDVLNDTYDWMGKLTVSIEKIKNGDYIENHYLCNNNDYDKFLMQ
jgi:very-short-patch-repair endonuclease